MQTEFEAKFLGVDVSDLRGRLSGMGFSCASPRTRMTRKAFHRSGSVASDRHEWWRIRDEGRGRVTMAYKRVDGAGIESVREVEIVVEDFGRACILLETTGLVCSAFQENFREIWVRGELFVMIDEWPGLAPFAELEGPDAASVTQLAGQLGFSMEAAVFGAVGQAYERELGLAEADINALPEILFSIPPIRKAG